MLEMHQIVKRFPGVIANDKVSLDIRQGEIHGLLGENGAGKSTLMKILYGLYTADGGEIYYEGERVEIDSPEEAIDLGIGMVHQHFMLIPRFSVEQNIILGEREPTSYFQENEDGGLSSYVQSIGELFTIGTESTRSKIERIANDYGLDVDPRTKVWDLDVGQQQRVEIIKALYRDAELLILDEPTAVLSPEEAEELFETMRNLASRGKSIIFITHKLNEVKEVTDRVTVLRGGKQIETVETEDVSQADMAEMMVGREVLFEVDKKGLSIGDPLLEVENLTAYSDRGIEAVSGVDLTVNEKEIVGIAGVSGNGQNELAESLVGLREIADGAIRLDGTDLTDSPPRKFAESGISYVPEDRLQYGCAPELDVMRNSILNEYRSDQFGHYLSMDYESATEYAEEIVEKYGVRGAPEVDVSAGGLSGGNLQKLIVGREIHRDPDIIVTNQPTRGVDVGSIEDLRNLLLEQQESGTGVVLISEDLDELFDLSDRILVIYEGEFVYETTASDATRERIGLEMTGGTADDSETGTTVRVDHTDESGEGASEPDAENGTGGSQAEIDPDEIDGQQDSAMEDA
jgi:simple sugar transport system ATP-binding protein